MNIETGEIYRDEAAIKAAQDRGEKLIRIPHEPKKDCPRCKGKGFIRAFGVMKEAILCPDCYPMKERAKWQGQ